MKSQTKDIKLNTEGKQINQDFMFPGNPPVTVQAKNIQEAEEKYKQIINNKK